MLRVGLTGGIATGKSRVRAGLAAQGLYTLDLDALAHDVVQPGRPAHAEIVDAFGPAAVGADGHVDRRALGAIVFSDAAARERLNAIVHPRVFEEEARTIAALAPAASDVVVTDATLHVEAGYHLRFDRLLVTVCDRRQQIARIMQRDGLSAGAAQARVESQMDGREKARYGHHVIDTSGDVAATDAAAASLASELKTLARAWPAPAPVSVERGVGALLGGAVDGPRGLRPLRLLEILADAGTPPPVRLARDLVPPHEGPWYEAGRNAVDGPGAETLMAPVVLWSFAWHGPEAEALLAAAATFARLVDDRPSAIAVALSTALALHDVAIRGSVPADLGARVRSRDALIQRWAGGPPPSALLEQLDRVSQGAAAPGLAATLYGLARGADPARAPEAAEAVRRLEASGAAWRTHAVAR